MAYKTSSRGMTLETKNYPYPENDGQTHWDGCWRHAGHHNCAVREVERLQEVSMSEHGQRLNCALCGELDCSGEGHAPYCRECAEDDAFRDQQWDRCWQARASKLRRERDRRHELAEAWKAAAEIAEAVFPKLFMRGPRFVHAIKKARALEAEAGGES